MQGARLHIRGGERTGIFPAERNALENKTDMNEDSGRRTGINSWYDGFLYHAVIGPFARPVAVSVAELVEKNSRVLDVGCGVGQLVFMLSQKCRQVTGIDFSKRMVEHASKQKAKRNVGNADFVFGDAAEASQIFSQRFDFVTATMCLHEMNCQSRHRVLSACLELADRVILVDYAAPFPNNIWGATQVFIELCAGKQHYAGFRDWQDRGGMDGFTKQERLSVQVRLPWKNRMLETVVVSGRDQ